MKLKSVLFPVLGVLILLFFLLSPPLAPLTELGMKVVGIFLFTVIWWVSVGVGYPSIISVLLLALTGVMKPNDAFAASWGNWVPLFVIGSFGLSECLKITGFSRRFAFWFITRPFVAGRPWLLVTMFLTANIILGSVMPLTPTCVIFMAIAEPMLLALGYKKGDPFAAMLMMGIAWISTAAAGMTPIGQTGNMMMMEWVRTDLKFNMNFLQWMGFGIPTGFLVLGAMLLIFRFLVRIDVSKIKDMATDYFQSEMAKMGSMKLEEKLALVIFLGVVFIWMAPSFIGGLLPGLKSYLDAMGFAVPPLLGACLMCLVTVKGKPLLGWREWMLQGVEWGTISLLAAIFALSAVIAKPETGIPDLLNQAFKPLTTGASVTTLVIVTVVWVVLQTNAMSNIVTETIVYRIMVPIMVAAGTGNAVALGAVISAASNCAFALPSATPPTAIATGSGWVPVGFMAKYGVLLMLPVMLIFIVVGYPLAALLFR
jgi:sodium-dependent dicarboxylate transporter 2/3/5